MLFMLKKNFKLVKVYKQKPKKKEFSGEIKIEFLLSCSRKDA